MTSAASSSTSSPSFVRTHIKSGDNVLLRLPSGDYRNLKVHDKPGRITLGKFGSFHQKELIGHPYGLSYEILPEGKIRVRQPETMTELEDTSATNELINDGNFVQPLTYEEIETLKKTPGVHSSEIIKMQITQNANYEMKSEYSKEKYKKRKEAKFLQGFSILEPNMFNICEYWFVKDPQRVRGIRADSLGQMMSFGNIRPGARVLVVDDTGGLLVAAVLERLGGEGRLLTITDSESPPTYHVVEQLNLNTTEAAGIMTYLSWAEIDEEWAPVEAYEPEEYRTHSQKVRSEKRHARAEELRKRREEFWAGEWNALVVASEYEPFSIIERVEPYLAGSGSIVVHSPYLQTLTDVHQKLRAKPQFLGPSVTEAWLRQYQVLPGRTHPMMNMSGSGGYLLSAMKVYDDETANSEWIARTAQRKARKQRNAEKTSSSTPIPQDGGGSPSGAANGHAGPSHAATSGGTDGAPEAPIANADTTEPADEVMDSD
ncbi:tRNA (adenine(58)-N(1))-methyltransferase non-catalytic subunit trm6 [Tulasnella sp. 417]|nr:tRNA (adenine(58)-N(1))-methyltransferase non-catalytic subunit trm6 [Tulasnella sp. 417]